MAYSPSLFLYSWLFLTGGSVCSHLLTLVHRSRIFLPWRWRRYVPPKRRLTQDLHSATSQKTTFFIVTAVKASNRTCTGYLEDTSQNCYYMRHLAQWPHRTSYMKGMHNSDDSPLSILLCGVNIPTLSSTCTLQRSFSSQSNISNINVWTLSLIQIQQYLKLPQQLKSVISSQALRRVRWYRRPTLLAVA
jgi:hypothetical protein